MAKHKCGTCRFFEEAGLAGSGWCHHPLRNVTHGALIMVRRAELACRDDWDHSLWEGQSGAPADPVDDRRRNGLGPLPAATPESLRTLMRRTEIVAPAGEDVLVSEARIVSEPQTRWDAEPRQHPGAGFDPRTAIFKAREAYRDRTRAKTSAARHAAGAEAVATDDLASRDGESSLAPVAVPWDAGEDSGGAGFADRDSTGQRSEESSNQRRSIGGPSLSADDFENSPPGWPIDESENTVAAGYEANPDGLRDEWDDENRPPVAEEAAAVRPPEHVTVNIHPSAPRVPRVPMDLPQWFRTDLPRICRSCRDYRPAVDGQRGWCTNAWAFTHSRLVQADEPAPCQSAIGDWWAPADEVWLVAADVSAHGRATPLLDRAEGEEAAKRRRS